MLPSPMAKRVIFQDVNIKFTPGPCDGLIGGERRRQINFSENPGRPDGTGSRGNQQSTGQRIAVLSQDQFAFDEHTVFNTVIMGHKKLYKIMAERADLYARADLAIRN